MYVIQNFGDLRKTMDKYDLHLHEFVFPFHKKIDGAHLEPKFLTSRPTIVFLLYMGTPMERVLIFSNVVFFLVLFFKFILNWRIIAV